MQNWIDTYESIQNEINTKNVRTISYWNDVKEEVYTNLTDYDYGSYCYDVVNKIMDDEMNGQIGGHVLLDLIKIGLPYYSAIRN